MLKQIRDMRQIWANATFKGTYADAKEQAHQITQYKRSSKRSWVSEKAELVSLLGNIKTKLATYRLKDYDPPDHLTLEVLEKEWNSLLVAEKKRSTLINEKIREYDIYHQSSQNSKLTNNSIKEALRRSFADRANEFALILSTVHLEISGLNGDLEVFHIIDLVMIYAN